MDRTATELTAALERLVADRVLGVSAAVAGPGGVRECAGAGGWPI